MFGQTDNNRPQAAFAIWRDEDGQWWAQARSAATLAVIDTEYRRLSSLANHAMSPAVAQAIHDAGVIRDLGDRIRALEPGEGTT